MSNELVKKVKKKIFRLPAPFSNLDAFENIRMSCGFAT
jgi:hypothetical protein